jgi:hypothetical protein
VPTEPAANVEAGSGMRAIIAGFRQYIVTHLHREYGEARERDQAT